MNQPFRLKAKLDEEDYPLDECAALRCTAAPVVDDDSKVVWGCRVPLCEIHWCKRSKEEEPCKVKEQVPIT